MESISTYTARSPTLNCPAISPLSISVGVLLFVPKFIKHFKAPTFSISIFLFLDLPMLDSSKSA
jgi:hypothetical protein